MAGNSLEVAWGARGRGGARPRPAHHDVDVVVLWIVPGRRDVLCEAAHDEKGAWAKVCTQQRALLSLARGKAARRTSHTESACARWPGSAKSSTLGGRRSLTFKRNYWARTERGEHCLENGRDTAFDVGFRVCEQRFPQRVDVGPRRILLVFFRWRRTGGPAKRQRISAAVRRHGRLCE